MAPLELNKLISIEQHGFVSSKACVTNLLECLDRTTNALHIYRKLDVLYTDFMKTFDKVYDSKLIHKLGAYGFRCKLIDWICELLYLLRLRGTCSFLTNLFNSR